MYRIRYNQEITLSFRREQNNVIVESVHEFSYKGKMTGDISIFSDFRGLSAGKSALQDIADNDVLLSKLTEEWPEFRFLYISDNEKKHSWDNAVDDLNKIVSNAESAPSIEKVAEEFRGLIRLKNNKLFYGNENIIHSQDRKLKFRIHGTYSMNDRLVWCIQDISENFGITINIDPLSGLKSEDFRFTINHPQEEQIICSLDGKIMTCGTLKFPSTHLLISHVVLPYQSFEISWKVN